MIERRLDSASSDTPMRSVAEVLQSTAALTENVVRGEIRLAVVRVQDQLMAQARRVVFLAMSAVLGLVAFIVLLVAGIMRLSYEADMWLVTLGAGLLVGVVALILFFLTARTNGAES
jgi:uncharacterized membrane protein